MQNAKLFVSIKSSSSIIDNDKNGELWFDYGDMKVYDISLEDFKIMVKFDNGSVKTLSVEDKDIEFEYSLEKSISPAPLGEYSLEIKYRSLSKVYKVFVVNKE